MENTGYSLQALDVLCTNLCIPFTNVSLVASPELSEVEYGFLTVRNSPSTAFITMY